MRRDPFYALFIDLHKAYDSVPRASLWQKLLEAMALPPELVHRLQLLYVGLTVRLSEDVAHDLDPIRILIGLK